MTAIMKFINREGMPKIISWKKGVLPMKNQEQYKKQIRSIYRNEALLEKMDFYKEFNSKQFEHMTHIEVIDGKYLLFDYKNRDPLSKAANIINVTKYVDGNE